MEFIAVGRQSTSSRLEWHVLAGGRGPRRHGGRFRIRIHSAFEGRDVANRVDLRLSPELTLEQFGLFPRRSRDFYPTKFARVGAIKPGKHSNLQHPVLQPAQTRISLVWMLWAIRLRLASSSLEWESNRRFSSEISRDRAQLPRPCRGCVFPMRQERDVF